MNIELCKYKNNASCAFSFTFDDGCYYDSTMEVIECFKDAYEKYGVNIKATVGITVAFMHERLINMWREAISSGYFDVASHTFGHDIAFCKDTPYEVMKNDCQRVQSWLRETFPGQKAGTFIFAGGNRDEEGARVLSEYFFACRAGGEGVNYAGKIDWLDLHCLTAMLSKNLSYFTDYIDKTLETGGWGIQMNHWITHKSEDVFHSQNADIFKVECDYLAKKSQGGKIWTGSLEEVGAYLRKYENSELSVTENDGKIKVEIVSNSDTPKEILDTELTILINDTGAVYLYGENGEKTKLLPDENGNILINTAKMIEIEPVLE